jgi:hypothetical protein
MPGATVWPSLVVGTTQVGVSRTVTLPAAACARGLLAEGDVEAGMAEFEHRLAVADSQRADDARRERLNTRDVGRRGDCLCF